MAGTMVYQKQRIVLCRVASGNMNTDHFILQYVEVKEKLVSFHDRDNVGTENGDGNSAFFLRNILLFSYKSASSLNSTMLVAFIIHITLQNILDIRENA